MKHFVPALCLLIASAASAQSLGDVARKEEERRKAIAKPAKVYTNQSLKSEPPAAPATPAPASGAGTPATPADAKADATAPASSAAATKADGVKPDAAKADGAKPDGAKSDSGKSGDAKNEAYWHKRITEVRDALSRDQLFEAALQSRINALSADFVNRDDPAQRAVIASDRQRALAELDRVHTEIRQYQRAIVDIEEEARRANVPPGWLR